MILFIIGIILGTCLGFVICSILTMGRIDDLKWEIAMFTRREKERNLAEGLSQILGDQ